MEKKTENWRSPSLGKDMELTVYGKSGTPIIGLPTRGASCHQWEEFGMVDAISYQLDNEFNQLFCLSSIDKEGFLNDDAMPSQRIIRQQQYEAYIVEEVVPYILEENNIDFIIIAGIDLGGCHALTTALKHPQAFGKAIGMSGIYDIKPFMDGFYDDDVYYNNPMDFVPNMNKQSLLERVRDIDFRLVSYEADERKEDTLRMSNVMRMKFIEHDLDIWGETGDEWELWPQMLKTHVI
ncbi:esterase family protein [Fodinibius saliphilus]|uniref:esterase family protein n=1 Tax=Fodinibius saliphilus TaxID=1920650 RepID=UPI001109DE06|nr:alpha/beta fold hydrolase [Fodinibius saliphilus]